MKNIIKIIVLLMGLAALVDVSFGQGDAPAVLRGLNQVDKSIGSTIRTPHGQVTKLSSSSALIETGNKNILENPSFEHSIYDTTWIFNSGASSKITVNADSTKVFHGINALKMTMTAQPMDIINTSPTSNQAYKDGVQGLISVMIKTTVAGVKVCQRVGFSTNCNNSVSVTNNGKWGLYKLPVILGEFYNGIAITTNGVSVTGDVYVDDAFVGAVDLQASVDASKIAGESYFNETASCTWSRTSTAYGPFTATAACPGPTITYSSMGQWQTTDSDLPRQTINNLPAGTYEVFAIMPVVTNSGASATSRVLITDGTTQCQGSASTWGATSTLGGVASCTFTYNSSGNRTFEVYGSDSAGQIQLNNTASSVKFIVKYFGNSSIYSSTNADTDWASCGLTGSAFTGFGSSVPTPSLQCKRQGADLLIKGTFTAGTTPTAVEARMALPIWNGVQLVSANSSIIPSLQLAGSLTINFNAATFFGEYVLIEPSTSYVTFSLQTSTVNAFTKGTGVSVSGTGNSHSINARIPIEGWQGSNIIVGSFNGLQNCTDTIACTDIFSATISSAGVVSNENVDFITGNCSKGGTGITNCTINSGVFSVIPNLVATIDDGAGACREVRSVGTNTTTSFRVDTLSSAGAAADCQFKVIFQKQGVDYVGKTALAVASDQNIRTPGVTKAVVYSAFIGAAGTVSSEVGDLISGSCTVATTNVFTCSFTAGIFAADPLCQLTVMGASGASRSAYIVTNPTTSGLTYLTYNTTGPTATALNVMLTCHGVSP